MARSVLPGDASAGAPAAEPEAGQIAQSEHGVAHARWLALLVLALTALLYFARLGARALWASEFRWAEIVREMLLTHDYLWPTINGRVYFDKPLGSYWLVLGCSWLTGGVDEVAARIPCAVAGLLAVGLLMLLARRLYGFNIGIAAGFILATSFSFVFWSRTASADVETVAGELAALLIFLNHEERLGWWVVPIWLMMALTSLMKGLLGFVLPILVIGVYSCVAEGWAETRRQLLHGTAGARLRWLIERNRWLFNWRSAVAVVLAAAVYYAPFALSHARSGSAKGLFMVSRENVERYFAPFDHRGPIYLYLYAIFALMVPWSLFLPAALVHAHQAAGRQEHRERSDRFVLVFFWATFVFFTLSGSRRSYYILPIFPAAAILIARLFGAARQELSRWVWRLLNLGEILIIAAVVLSLCVFLPPRWFLPRPYSLLPMAPHRMVFALCWVGAALAAAWALRTYRPQRVLLAVGVLSYLLMVYLFIFAMPAGDHWRGEKRFAHQVRRLIDGHPSELASFRTLPPVFYLGLTDPVPEYNSLPQLDRAVSGGHTRWLVVRRREMPVVNLPGRIVAAEATYPWDPRQHRLNALVLLDLGQ